MHCARRLAWLRFAVALLSALVAVGAALPTYARLVSSAPTHACHCEARGGHAHCACPICFPDLPELNDDGVPGLAAVKGKCGDDDPGWRTLAQPVVPGNDGFVITSAPVHARIGARLRLETLDSQWSMTPEPRPPRARIVVVAV